MSNLGGDGCDRETVPTDEELLCALSGLIEEAPDTERNEGDPKRVYNRHKAELVPLVKSVAPNPRPDHLKGGNPVNDIMAALKGAIHLLLAERERSEEDEGELVNLKKRAYEDRRRLQTTSAKAVELLERVRFSERRVVTERTLRNIFGFTTVIASLGFLAQTHRLNDMSASTGATNTYDTIIRESCKAGVRGKFTTATQNPGAEVRVVEIGTMQDVETIAEGIDSIAPVIFYKGGFTSAQCKVEAGILPYSMASFDPRNKNLIASSEGNLHFTPDQEIPMEVKKTYLLPDELNVSDDCPTIWMNYKPDLGVDQDFVYEISINNTVHGGFIGTLEHLSKLGLARDIEVTSECNSDQGKKGLSVDEFLQKLGH